MVPWTHHSLHPKRHVDRFSRFCTVHRRVSHYITMGRYVFPKLPLFLGGSGPPPNTWYLGPARVIKPNGISIGSAVFRMGPKCYAVQCIVTGEENPQNCPFPSGFCHPAGGGPSYSDRQHARKIW